MFHAHFCLENVATYKLPTSLASHLCTVCHRQERIFDPNANTAKSLCSTQDSKISCQQEEFPKIFQDCSVKVTINGLLDVTYILFKSSNNKVSLLGTLDDTVKISPSLWHPLWHQEWHRHHVWQRKGNLSSRTGRCGTLLEEKEKGLKQTKVFEIVSVEKDWN